MATKFIGFMEITKDKEPLNLLYIISTEMKLSQKHFSMFNSLCRKFIFLSYLLGLRKLVSPLIAFQNHDLKANEGRLPQKLHVYIY